MELRDEVRWLTLVASILIVTYNSVGAPISGLSDLKNMLTKQISVLTKNVTLKYVNYTLVCAAAATTTTTTTTTTTCGWCVVLTQLV